MPTYVATTANSRKFKVQMLLKSIYEYECEHYFSSSEIRPEKIQASTAFEPMISAYDLICSQSFTHHFTGLLRTK